MDVAAYHKAVDQLEWMLAEGAGISGGERNVLYLNTRGTRFTDASFVSGLDFPDDARACGSVDWDRDGDLDLWLVNRNGPQVRFMRNDADPANHWVAFDLRGTAKTTNPDAIGARIEVRLAGDTRPLLRTLRAGEGFLSQGSKRVHFGLGRTAAIEKVTVRWPGGASEAFTGVGAGSAWQLVQGSGRAVAVGRGPVAPELVPQPLPNTKLSVKSRSVLSTRVPFPPLAYTDAQGKARTLETANGKPLLVMAWTSWCCQCEEELAALAAARKELDSAGVRLLALSLDEADDNPADRQAALDLAKAKGFTWPVGFLDRGGIDRVRGFYSALYSRHPPLPTPTSFLLDGNGRLVAFYKGPLDPADLRRDLSLCVAPAEKLLDLAMPFGGRRYSAPSPFRILDFARQLQLVAGGEIAGEYVDAFGAELALQGGMEALTGAHELRLRIARALRESGRADAARRHLDEALKLLPDSALAHLRLGELLAETGDADGAARHLGRALELDPSLQPQVEAARGAARGTGSSR